VAAQGVARGKTAKKSNKGLWGAPVGGFLNWDFSMPAGGSLGAENNGGKQFCRSLLLLVEVGFVFALVFSVLCFCL